VTDVRTLQLSATPQLVVVTPPVTMDDKTHVPELGGEFTSKLTDANALRSLFTVAVNVYVWPATKDKVLITIRDCAFVNNGSTMLEKLLSRPDASDQVTLKEFSTCALKTIGTAVPALTLGKDEETDILGTVPATMFTVLSAKATRESALFVMLSLKKYGREASTLMGNVLAGMVSTLVLLAKGKVRGTFIVSTHGKLFRSKQDQENKSGIGGIMLVSKSLEFCASNVRFWETDHVMGAEITAKIGRIVITNDMLSLAVKPSINTDALIV